MQNTAFYSLSTIAQVLPTFYAACAVTVYFAQEAMTAHIDLERSKDEPKIDLIHTLVDCKTALARRFFNVGVLTGTAVLLSLLLLLLPEANMGCVLACSGVVLGIITLACFICFFLLCNDSLKRIEDRAQALRN